jgi:methanogenic corrinoid protein MtbC1
MPETAGNPGLKNYHHLALRALFELAESDSKDPDHTQLLHAFCQAFTMDNGAHRDQMISYLHKAGLSDDDIVDQIVPTAARRIGEMWLKDELTFAQVTISASRMQEMSRFLCGRNHAAIGGIPFAGNALMIIPSDEQHTMGGFVAADQMRRQGLSVHMAIGQTREEIARTVAARQFSMIGISAASRHCLDAISAIVEQIKQDPLHPPVILGGNLIDVVDDIEHETGVDLASSDPCEALEFCGLPKPQPVLLDPIIPD